MFRLGVCTENDYIKAGQQRRFSGARVAYHLLDIGANPTKEQIRLFEDISFTLRTSNGTYRTTFRNRLLDVDFLTTDILKKLYQPDTELLAQDRAASHGLTSLEWARQLFAVFPNSTFEASDTLLYLIQLTLAGGETYILEPTGQALQYINPPFVVDLFHREALILPFNRLVAARARVRLRHLKLPEGWMETSGGRGFRVSKIQCIHPEALSYAKTNPRFQFRMRSIFDITPNSIHVLRTMNILNRDYFSIAQLRAAADVAFQNLKMDGIWIVGRTLEEDFSNHVTFLQKKENRWKIIARLGKGSDVEDSLSPLKTAIAIV